ncbi:hypothetical protein J2X65_001304 [Ancylobacter sp. 3268]|nr:hypothetical protein [Ancylobacter sp. 3268]
MREHADLALIQVGVAATASAHAPATAATLA